MPDPQSQAVFCQEMDTYRGIWHGQPDFFPEYGPKYGGGLATYPYQTRPMAVYAEAVHQTFFCWGGTTETSDPHTRYWDFQEGALLQMVASFDHRSGTVSKPVCVFDKWCADPHDNPALQMDPEGYLWLFSPSHGDWTTRSYIHRSFRPYDIRQWETISDDPLFAYPQPWVDAEWGWMFLHTEYGRGRGIRIKRSREGRNWTSSVILADMGEGHYQVSWFDPLHRKLATVFDLHPDGGGLDARTNLYFMHSEDGGETWCTVEGKTLSLPVADVYSPALVYDYAAEGKLVYLRDVKYTADGRPVILYLTSRGYEPGSETGPRQWHTALWTGREWSIREAFLSDNNYDHGELLIQEGKWRVIAPTGRGPQPGNPGGELELWVSKNEGNTWSCARRITEDSRYNHTFARVPYRAHPEVTAFWADGDARRPSPSSLYVCDSEGKQVIRLGE